MKLFPKLMLGLTALIGFGAMTDAEARDRRRTYRTYRTSNVLQHYGDYDYYHRDRDRRHYRGRRVTYYRTAPRYYSSRYYSYPRYSRYYGYPRYSYYRPTYYSSYPSYYRSYPYYRSPGITIAFGGLFGGSRHHRHHHHW
jgi:hypothetical protein